MSNSRSREALRQYVEGFPVTIERYTDKVPSDGRFYVLEEDRVIGRFRTLSGARSLFLSLLASRGYTPRPAGTQAPASSTASSIERYLDAKEEYWANSYRFRTGGKLKHR